MRLALAIASFVVLIVHGVVFYDQFFHKLGAAPDRLLRTGAVAGQERDASEPSWKRARRASSRSS